ncbi:MAG TPA: ECF-type sigma factor [Planctomycetota bacterium]
MRPDDRRPEFPSTRWSRILSPAGERDLDGLARAYWRPIQAYLAAKLRCRDDEASDMAQDAFAWLMTSGLLDKADPARGRFRGFLKKALANFANELWRKAHAKKRGGAVTLEALDESAEPVDPSSRTPDQVLDDAWRRELLEIARAELQRELETGGRAVHWALFRDYFLADGDEPDHNTLAQRFGITRTDVSNWLDHGKRRYRAILRTMVAETVTTEDELQEELRWLFGAEAPGSEAPARRRAR